LVTPQKQPAWSWSVEVNGRATKLDCGESVVESVDLVKILSKL